MTLKDVLYTFWHFVGEKKLDISLDQINRYLEFANEELKRTVYGRIGEEKGFENEQQIMDALLPFKTFVNISLTNGAGNLPADYWHKARMEVTSNGYEVKFVTSEECARRRNNSITQPTTTYPIVELKDGIFQVYPTSITQVTLVYLKKGNTPKIALKLENAIQIYDSSNSVELEWSTTDKYLDIVRIMLGYVNVPISNEQILSYVEQKVDKEN
jgi:hypothetical protein